MKIKLASLITVIALCFTLTGCGALSTLKTIVDVTESAIPILESSGVPLPPEIPQYVSAVATCIGSPTGPANAQQILVISSCLSGQIAPTLPKGTPQTVANVIAGITKAVADYLAKNPALAPAPSSAALKAAKSGPALNPTDAAKLAELRARATNTAAKAKALVKR